MPKKKKYIPGAQRLKYLQDQKILKEAREKLDEYYEQQRRRDEEYERQVRSTRQRQQNNNTNSKNTKQVEQGKEERKEQVSPAQPQSGGYSTISAKDYEKLTSDPYAFKDQFIPSILDPEFNNWAARQVERSGQYDEQSGYYKSTTAADTATSAAAAGFNLMKEGIQNADKRESVPDRLNRRITENNMFGKLNKDKALTNNEINEILAYKTITDPVFGYNKIKEDLAEIEAQRKKEIAELQGVEEPESYYGESVDNLIKDPVGQSEFANIFSIINSAWAKSFFSDFMEESNSSQLKVSVGRMQRSKELLDMSNSLKDNIDLLEEFANNVTQLQRFTNKQKMLSKITDGNTRLFGSSIEGLYLKEQEAYSNILQRNKEIRELLGQNDWWKQANNLASWAPKNILSAISTAFEGIVDDDLGGIRTKLYGLDSELDEIKNLMNERNHDEDWLNKFISATDKVKRHLDRFDRNTKYRQKGWQRDAETDAKDLIDWRNGNNVLNANLKVDPYYGAQKQILEKQNFDWRDPTKMAMFGWSGIAGGSNSSWWKQGLNTVARVGGAIGGAITTGGTSAAIQAATILTAYETAKASGSDENNIESGSRTSEILKNDLIVNGKYEDFLKEGKKELEKNKLIKDLLDSAPDKQKEEDNIIDAYILGLWHSVDPKITRMHSEAVVGANNQFYNNQPVNTADAAVESVVSIANLAPVKWGARATKIISESTKRRIARSALGENIGLRYQGFKQGLSNLEAKVVESQIGKLVKDGVIVTGDAAKKFGASVGNLAGEASLKAGSVLKSANAPFIGVENKIARQYAKVRAFATSVPKVWMNAAATAKTAANVSTRIGLDTASEMLQEGVQGLNASRDPYYDPQYNRSMALRIFDDMMLGAEASWMWLNQNNPELMSEGDVVPSMNATPLLTLFGPGSVQVLVQGHNLVKDWQINDVIAHNIDATRRGNIAELEQGRDYAKYLSKEQRDIMLKRFDNYKKIAGSHRSAMQRLQQGISEDALMEQDEHFIPDELIDQQIKDYQDIYDLGNSIRGRYLGETVAGAKFGSDHYAQVISMLNFRTKRRAEAFEALRQKDREQPNVASLAALDANTLSTYDDPFSVGTENETEQPKNIRTSGNNVNLLLQAAAFQQIVDDYSAIQKLNKKQNLFLDRAKSRLNVVKKALKNAGIEVDSYEDIVEYLKNSNEGDVLFDYISKDLPLMNEIAQQSVTISTYEDPFSVTNEDNNASLDDIINYMIRSSRQRAQLEFDFIQQDQMFEDFLKNPNHYIDRWNRRLESDEKLEAILEEDYVNNIRRYEHAAARDVKDGDIYQGNNGRFYVVKEKKDKNGNPYFVKSVYHPRTHVIESEELEFDRIEYDEAKTALEKGVAEAEKNRRANRSIQTGSSYKESEEQQAVQEEPLNEKSVEEPARESEEPSETQVAAESGAEPSEEPGEQEIVQEKPAYEEGDLININGRVGKVKKINTDGSIEVSFYTGRNETYINPSEQNIQKVNSPIKEPEYDKDHVIHSGDKNYIVAEVKITDIDPDTYEPQYVYSVMDTETSEVQEMSAQQIKDLEKVKSEEEKSKEVTPNEAQQAIIELLRKKREKDAKQVGEGEERRITGHDYFIKIKNRINRFIRVHGILDELFEESEDDRTYRIGIQNRLRELWSNPDKKEFIEAVKEYQKEYNQKLEQKYGAGSELYKYHKIDLAYYYRGKVIEDEGIIPAIASILSNKVTGPAVVAGTYLDEIARDFFQGKAENKAKYKMSDDVFNAFIDQLATLQERFNDLGWVVDTNEYTWYGEMKNGQKIAGTTDMIAIDREGHIHVLDFKSTASYVRFERVTQYKQVNDDGTETWVNVTQFTPAPEGAEIRVSSSFIDDVATKERGTVKGKRTYAQQYTRQLEVYRLLIQQETGQKVTSLEVIPFYVNYNSENDGVTQINDVRVYNPVDLTKIPQVNADINEIDNYLNSQQTTTKEEIEQEIEQIREKIRDARSKSTDRKVSPDTLVRLIEHSDELERLIQKYEDAKNDAIKLADSVFIEGLRSQKDSIIMDLNTAIEEAIKEINTPNNDEIEPEPPVIDNDRKWLWDDPEPVVDSEKEHWWQYNNLHSLLSMVMRLPHYLETVAKRDFITNSKFVISRDDANDLDVFQVTIYYRGILKLKPMTILLGNNIPDTQKEFRNASKVEDRYLSSMGRNFLRQYYQLAKNLKPGERIVATVVKRTNGTLIYEGKEVNLQDTQFFSKDDPRLFELINGDDSLIGVTIEGTVREIQSGNRNFLYGFTQEESDEVVDKKANGNDLQKNINSRTVPNGLVVFLHKFKNEEDKESDDVRTVPIVLKGMKLAGLNGGVILQILQDVASSNTPGKTLNDLYKVRAYKKDGTFKETTVPGLTNKKVLKLLTRFGQQADYAGDEFVFDYLVDEDGNHTRGHQYVRITDMLSQPRMDEEGNLHRDIVELYLGDESDVNRLRAILAATDMHINQFGIMKANLNTENEDSPFGALATFFTQEENKDVVSIKLNRDIQIDVDDVFSKQNPSNGLTGIGWAIKHGYATTNASGLRNPLISIHELGKELTSGEIEKEQKENVIVEEVEEEHPVVAVAPEAEQEAPREENAIDTTPQENEKLTQEYATDEEIERLLDMSSDEDFSGLGGGLIVKRLRKEPLTNEEKKKVEKRLRRIVGKVSVEWVDGAIEILKSGAEVAGRTAVNGFKLSDRMVQGTEYHEAFHRVLEILVPNSRRQKIYDKYREKYNENFKRSNGRDLTDRDISEALAEMFRSFMIDREPIKLHWNILKTFREIKAFCDGLRNTNDRQFATLFILANSGVFKYLKPNKQNVEHFKTVLGGQSDLLLKRKDSDGNIKTINLDQIPDYGGRSIFNDAIDGIIYALCHNFSLDMLGSNGARLRTDFVAVSNLFRKPIDTTEHSSWFRVLTGEYAKPGEHMTVSDAIMYKNLYKNSEELRLLAAKVISENKDKDLKAQNVALIKAIIAQESSKTFEDLNQNQKILSQIFSKESWEFIEPKINAKLSKMSIDSEQVTYDEFMAKLDERDEDDNDENIIGRDAHDHSDEFFDHARSEDATAAIRFFLSSVPDERFATEEDVEQGLVKSLTNKKKKKNGQIQESPVTISNSTNLLGFNQFLSMKIVSGKLLQACNNATTVEELDQMLQSLKDTDPIFYRIATKYHAAIENQIKKTPSGKNMISVNGKTRDEATYEQHKDGYGFYYTEVVDGKDTGNIIKGAKTVINHDMESFVTQLFNFVATQKLDFIMVLLKHQLDDDGNIMDGSYITEVQHTDNDYASTVYPRQWFVRLRSGVTNVFRMISSGKYTFTKDGKKLFYDAIDNLSIIYNGYFSAKPIKINGVEIDRTTSEGFRRIENEFIKSLNVLGIDVSKEALEYHIGEQFGRNIPISTAFGRMLTKADKEISFKKFLDQLIDDRHGLKKRVTENGENSVLWLSRPYELIGHGRSKTVQYASGINLYTDNAFVKWIARGVSRYNKTNCELNVPGPENGNRYLVAQPNTISDMTLDYNKTVVVNGEVKNSKMMKDMAKYIYNLIKEAVPLANGETAEKLKGSIIIKAFFKEPKTKLQLHTNGGTKVDEDKNGGVSYKKITEREDWVSKAAILKEGGIIFPTLSDKSTWFYVTGVRVPGLDYKNLSNTPVGQLMTIGLHKGQDVNSEDLSCLFNFENTNAQLDQMIEYAKTEHDFIAREIERDSGKSSTLKKIAKIKFFEDNRKRFGGLTEIVVINEKGKKELILLNDYNKSPEECLEIADREFFNKPEKEKRKIMALTLERGFMENMDMLEHAGLIKRSGDSKHKLLNYSNIGLDNEVIKNLFKLYLSKYTEKQQNDIKIQNIAKSQAICQFVWDIYLRGIISNEEVERLYTGQSHFFKWVHEKIYDVLSGKTINVLVDRFGDQSKRLGGAGSTGDRNRTDLVDVSPRYKAAEVKDYEVTSRLHKAFEDNSIDSYVRQEYVRWQSNKIRSLDISEEEKQQKLDELNDKVYGKNKPTLKELEKEFVDNGVGSIYDVAVARGKKVAQPLSGGINVADGAAYITPEMTKTLLRMRGRYTSKVAKAFDYLEGKGRTEDGKRINPLYDQTAYQIIFDALLGAQKYSAYGYRIDSSTQDIPVHYYNKFALFPIFPQIATGFTANVLKKMQEDGVDMLMLDSAVKIGSQDAQEFNQDTINDKEKLNNFHFKPYEQEFSFIRRQLNTDPHEKDTTKMGTQMTKVALTNLNPNMEYTTPDGKKVRGRDLLNNIMNCINALSDIGRKRIEKEFFKDGKFDIEKFSVFLERELENRDADENLIDGIQVIEKNGKKKFKVTLEAMSSVDWIQSILISKINKEVCDINVKGNAFYQRSVWGMEGKPIVLDEKDINFNSRQINDGKELNFINNDGSMDAVISIDFFYDIIPEGIRNNFTKSRQWLLDHKIIGNTADVVANTIASRIPTQAQSSIHALRFVDVLPVVRDTIVLPREFTKITGSDFDIDKLYLVRYSYNVHTTNVDGKPVDTVSTEFKEGSENYYRNNLINGYMTLLKDHGVLTEDGNGKITIDGGGSSHISMRSIDDDTKLITNFLKRIQKNQPKRRYYAYQFGNIAFQVATKAAFMMGKFGIGPFALNNNNQILTQLYGVKFAKSSGHKNILESLGCLDLSNPTDKTGNSILSWISGLINIHVDVAKNPEPPRALNINTYTYNVVNLLMRTGMGERTLAFTAQPIMFELARVYEDASGQYMTDISKSKSSRQRTAIRQFIKDSYTKSGTSKSDMKFIDEMMMGYNSSEEEKAITEQVIGSFAKAIFGIKDDGSYQNYFEYVDQATGNVTPKEGCILEDILTNPEVLINKNKPATFDNMSDGFALYNVHVLDRDGNTQEIQLTPKQVQQYVFFIQNALSKYGQGLSDLVNACKIDTKKHGKSYVEQKSYLSKYDKVFDNESMMFEEEGLRKLKGENGESYIDKKTKNATELYETVLKEISIQATDSFVKTHDKILVKLNSSEQNTNLSKKVTKAIMTWIKTQFFYRYIDDNNYDINELFYGDDNIQTRLLKLQNAIKQDRTGKYKRYGKGGVITNSLLKALQADIYEEKEDSYSPVFLKLENSLLEDSDNANAIERAWDDMYTDEDHPEIQEFAKDLAIYAFLTSGDQPGMTKFFRYVPNSIRNDLKITLDSGEEESYSEYIDRMRRLFSTEGFELSDDQIDQIIEQNWYDEDFVKTFNTVRYSNGKKYQTKTAWSTFNQKIKIAVRKGKNIRLQSVAKNTDLVIAGTVKIKEKGLIETIHRCNDDKYPSYIKIRRRGNNRYDSDNVLLYKFRESRLLDPNDENKGTYPVYELVEPSVSYLRAGSYSYTLFNYSMATNASYPKSIQEVMGMFDTIITDDTSKNKSLDQFYKALQDSSVWLSDEELENQLAAELEAREFEYTQQELQKAVEFISKKLNKDRDKESSSTSEPKVKRISSENKEEKTPEVKRVETKETDQKKENKSENKDTSEDKVIKISNDSEKYSKLMNTAPRQFTINGVNFGSVNQAYYYLQIESWNIDEDEKNKIRQDILQTVEFNDLKVIMKEARAKFGDNADNTTDELTDILYNTMLESLRQNQELKSLLISTGITPIKASNDIMTQLFTDVRNTLQEEAKKNKNINDESSKTKEHENC